jgi:hypothetical protein
MIRPLRRSSSTQASAHELVGVPPQSDVYPKLPMDRLARITEAVHGASTVDFASELHGFQLKEDREWYDLWPGKHY